MHFKVHRLRHPNLGKAQSGEYSLAKRFADTLHKELGDFLKAVILFGSASRGEIHTNPADKHDIDVLCILNDLTIILSPEVIEAYRVIAERTAQNSSRRLHITTLRLSTFWDYCRNADPVIINMLRDGIPLHDVGIFEPMQQLLFQGRIRPTKESVWNYYARAPVTLHNADWHVTQAGLDLYWAVVDAAHAALMHVGETPPSPEHVAGMLRKRFVQHKQLDAAHADTMDLFYKLQKDIVHRRLQYVTGKDYEHLRGKAHDFVRAMRALLSTRH